ncbi:MAG TPA: formylglycine-generating enzyme family protein [Polyangiaceae bacterium]
MIAPDQPPSERTIVDSFYLDQHEVMVGRLRAFVASYDAWRARGEPSEGAGAHPSDESTGWRKAWDTAIPRTAEEFALAIRECSGTPYSTFLPGYDSFPANCVSWHEAFAFCLWDGGRLPTEAEHMYATAGGGQNRLYPWGSFPEPTPDHAVYGCSVTDEGTEFSCSLADILPVGSRPLGAGRWTHQDLAGSMAEWVFDGSTELPPYGAYNPVRIGDERIRMLRGGDWGSSPAQLSNAYRSGAESTSRLYLWGFRCARDTARP